MMVVRKQEAAMTRTLLGGSLRTPVLPPCSGGPFTSGVDHGAVGEDVLLDDSLVEDMGVVSEGMLILSCCSGWSFICTAWMVVQVLWWNLNECNEGAMHCE